MTTPMSATAAWTAGGRAKTSPASAPPTRDRSRLEMTVAAKPTTGYAPVNGTNVYWESRGAEGTPLIVVHGGYGLTTMFGDVLDLLARQRQVVAIELRGHGHTRDIPGPFSWE